MWGLLRHDEALEVNRRPAQPAERPAGHPTS